MSFFSQQDRFVPPKDDGIKRHIFVPKSELSSRGVPKIIDDWNVDSSATKGRPMPELFNNPWNNLSMIRAHKDPPGPDIYHPNLDAVRPNNNTGAKWENNKSPRFVYPEPETEPPDGYVPVPPPSRAPSSFNKRLMALSNSSAKGVLRLEFLATQSQSRSPSRSHTQQSQQLPRGHDHGYGRDVRTPSPTHVLGEGLGEGLSFAPNASVDITDSSVLDSGFSGGFGFCHLDSYSVASAHSNATTMSVSVVGKSSHGNVRFSVPKRSSKHMVPSPPVCVPRCYRNDTREALKHLRVVLARDLPSGSSGSDSSISPDAQQKTADVELDTSRPESEIDVPAAVAVSVAVVNEGSTVRSPSLEADDDDADTRVVNKEEGNVLTSLPTHVHECLSPVSPVVETAERRKQKRDHARLQHRGAIRIQALLRGNSVRRASALKRFQQHELQTELAVNQHDHNYAAATKVQKLFRGNSVRRRKMALFREREQEKERQCHHIAAARVQSLFRGHSDRRMVMQRREERDRLDKALADAFDDVFLSPDSRTAGTGTSGHCSSDDTDDNNECNDVLDTNVYTEFGTEADGGNVNAGDGDDSNTCDADPASNL